MTDNVVSSAAIGSGDTFAAKDIAGIKYPRNILTSPGGADITPLSEGGAVSVSNFPASQAVTGTFWQATQPVSLASSPAPADITASGTITTQNLVPAGAATAGSAVEISLSGQNTLAIQTVGTYTGALSLQGTLDGATWVTVTSAALVNAAGSSAATILTAAQGIYVANVTGYLKARITGLAAMTGSVVVSLRASVAVSTVQLGAANASVGSVVVTSTTNLIGDVGQQYRANATGAASVAKILTAATTNATCPKASAGRLLGWHLTNTTAAVKVIHIHNLAVAPTVGTSVPMFSIVLPPNQLMASKLEGGMAMTTGLAYSITGAIGDLDATATAVGDVIGALYYA